MHNNQQLAFYFVSQSIIKTIKQYITPATIGKVIWYVYLSVRIIVIYFINVSFSFLLTLQLRYFLVN